MESFLVGMLTRTLTSTVGEAAAALARTITHSPLGVFSSGCSDCAAFCVVWHTYIQALRPSLRVCSRRGIDATRCRGLASSEPQEGSYGIR